MTIGRTGGNAAELADAAAAVGAFPLSADGFDAALLVDLDARAYTIIASGVGGTTGIALVEAYEIPTP